jgi:hypothetical protein
MMCSIHNDESVTCVKSCTATRLCVPFSEQLDSLLDCLDNQRMMHNFQSITIDYGCGKQNGTRYCSGVTPPRL